MLDKNSSGVVSNPFPTMYVDNSSVTSAPTKWAPNNSPVFLSKIVFIKPL